MKQNYLHLRLILICVFAFFCTNSLFSQGAVYPVSQELCATVANYTLTWSGTGAIDHWESNNGSGWSSIANTSSAVTFPTPAPGTHNYRTYVNLGGGVFQYSVVATVIVDAVSAAGGAVALTFDASDRCESDNSGTVVLGAGSTGSLINWVSSHTGSDPWQLVNQNTTTLTYNNLSETTYYKAVVQNGVCPSVMTTNTATISVLSSADGGDASTADNEICAGGTTLLSVINTNGTTLTWQKESGGVYSNVGSGVSYNLPTNLGAAVHSYRMEAIHSCKNAANATISEKGYSDTIQVEVFQATAVANPTGDRVVTYDDATVNTIVVTPSNGSVVRWEMSTDNLQWTPLSFSGTTYSYSHLTSTTYYRVVTQNGVCNEAVSTTAVKITVADGGLVSADEDEFCSTSVSGTLTLTDNEGTSFSWEKSVSPFAVWTGVAANTSTLAFSNLTETTKYRINMNSGLAFSDPITITVSSPSIAGSLSTANATVCSSDPTSRTITLSGNTGNVLRWESSLTGGAPWSSIQQTGTSLTFNNLTQTTWFRAVIQNGVCSEANTTAQKITVAAGGTVSGSASVCELDAAVSSLSLSGYEGVIDSWEKSEFNSGTSTWGAFTNIGNAGSATLTYTNLSTSTRYRAIIQSACVAAVNSTVAEITVYPISVGGTVAGDKTVRSGDNSGSITLTGKTGLVTRWEKSSTGSAPWTSISNTSTSLAYSDITETTFFRAVVQNGPCAEAFSTNSAVITVAQEGFVSDDASLCSGDPAVKTLQLNNYLGTISRWQKSINSGGLWTDIAGSGGSDTRTYSGLTQSTWYRVVLAVDGGELFSDYAIITVNPLPIPAFSTGSECLNDGNTFSNTSSITSGIILAHQWDFSDGNGSNVINPVHTFQADGTYPVKLILTSDKLCKDSVSIPVIVKPLPIVNFLYSDACDQTAVSFTNASNLPGHTLTPSWDFGDSFTSPSTDPSHTFPTNGVYTVILTEVSDGGCASAAYANVIIHPNPVPAFSAANVCDGAGMSFVNNAYIPTGNLNYSWDFGDLGASTFLNPSHLYAVADTFTTTLTVTSDMGCTKNISHDVIVFPVPVADFTASPNCFGLPSTFPNSSAISDGSLSYVWDFQDGNTSIATSPSHLYNAGGSYLVELTATSDNGCTDIVEKQVIINNVPTVNFAFTNVCQGDSMLFVNYSSIPADVLTYVWNFGDATPTSTLRDPHHLYATPGNYTVSLTVTSNHGCSASVSQIVSVWSLPVPAFSALAQCAGSATSFTNSSTIALPSTLQSYTWNFGDGNSSIQNAPVHTYSSPAVYSVTLQATSNHGCQVSITQNVTSNQNPVPAFTSSNVCIGDTMWFTNNSSGLVNPPVYLWDFGDGTGTSTAPAPFYIYTTTGIHTVTLTVTNANSCQVSTSHAVEVYKKAAVNFSFANPCEGQNIQFINSSVLSGGSMSFNWNLGNGNFSSNTDPTTSYPAFGVFPVLLTVTTDHGCVSSATQNITINQNPVTAFSAPDLCYGLNTAFINSTTLTTGTLSFVWDFDDNDTSHAVSPVHPYNSPGSYNVNLIATSSSGCIGSVTHTVKVFPVPFASFNEHSICAGTSITMDNVSTIESGTMTYSWDFGNSTSSTNDNPTLTYSNAGMFNIKMIATSDHQCTDTTIKIIQVYDVPVPAFASDSVCSGLTTVFTNQSTLASGTIVYNQWDFGDLGNSLQKNPHHKYEDWGTYATTLIIRSDKGCESMLTHDVTVNAIPVVNFSTDPVCLGKGMQFTDQTVFPSASTGTLTYVWEFGDSSSVNVLNPLHVYNLAKMYDVSLKVISNAGQCQDALSKKVTVYDLPKVKLGSDTSISKGFPLTLPAEASMGNYSWLPASGLSNSLILNPVATLASTTTYVLEVSDANGCQNKDSITVTVNDDFELLNIENTVSNLITPNGNGENETWVIPNISFYPHHIYIYDRWDMEVYSSSDYKNDWSGTNKIGDTLPDGTYYFVIKFTESNKVIKGAITLLQNLGN